MQILQICSIFKNIKTNILLCIICSVCKFSYTVVIKINLYDFNVASGEFSNVFKSLIHTETTV